MHLYIIFNLQLFLSIFIIVLISGIETPDLNGHLPFFFFFYESNTKGTNFWIMFICFYATSVKFDLVKSPEVTLCGL